MTEERRDEVWGDDHVPCDDGWRAWGLQSERERIAGFL